MAKPLPLDERIMSAAKLAVRARIHCDLWWSTASADNRVRFHDALDEHWEAWRFIEHAQFIAFMVTIYNLFGDRHGTIRFKKLSEELGGIAAEQIKEAESLAEKVRCFRDQLFAHRSDKLGYAQVFERAAITRDEMIRLAEAAVRISAAMLEARSLPEQPANDLPIKAIARILDTLQRDYEATTDHK